jgi:hypothetical protein
VRDLWRRGENPTPHASARATPGGEPHPWHTPNTKPHPWPGANRPRAGRRDGKLRSAEDSRPDPAASRAVPPQPPVREIGIDRRRLDAYRQRPDLRVINGEGTGGGPTRSGRLRPIPGENPGS